MKTNTAATLLVSLMLIVMSISAWSGDAKSDQVQEQQQTSLLPGIQSATTEASGYEAASIRVASTPHLVTITVINSKLNSAKRLDREDEAHTIAVAIEKYIFGKPAFSQVGTIHINYVQHKDSKQKLIQSIDFYKSATGGFSAHKS